ARRLLGEAARSRADREALDRHRDGRILGEGAFVAATLREVEGVERRRQSAQRRWKPVEVVRRAAESTGVAEERLYSRDRRLSVTEARAVANCWLVDELGMRVVDAAQLLRVKPPSICAAVVRGRRLITARGLRLEGGSPIV
ncbi:MAG: hypothetical protein AAB368_10565, partial [bacterium]